MQKKEAEVRRLLKKLAGKANPSQFKYRINLPAMPSYEMLPESYRTEYTGTMTDGKNLLMMNVPTAKFNHKDGGSPKIDGTLSTFGPEKKSSSKDDEELSQSVAISNK